DGLHGRVVLDARGIQPAKPDGTPDAFGIVDQSIRSLAVLLRGRTDLPILLDDKPELIPAGAASGVALYCGWYNPGKYVSGLKFVPGSVGYHIASYELTGLHNPNDGWCRGMI